MSHTPLTLADLGELRLIEEVILPLAREFDITTGVGDDCAYLQTEGRLLAVSADVGPKPLLQNLPGYESDLEAAGWLAVVATASDIATAGARPFFLTNCIDSPPELPVSDFTVFLRGYFKACAEFGFRNGGGDVRHGSTLSMRVFGAGTCDHGQKICRGGVNAGDQLAIIGPAGVFMATYLLAAKGQSTALLNGKLTDGAETILRYPRPQLKAMELLVQHGVLSAASDTSDGLLGAIDNLTRSSKCGFELHLKNSLMHPSVVAAAAAYNVDPWNIFFAWGDWSVAVTVPAERFNSFETICEQHSIQWSLLGQATSNTCTINARINQGQLVSVDPVRNENFISRGFNAEVKGHLDYILLTNLFSN